MAGHITELKFYFVYYEWAVTSGIGPRCVGVAARSCFKALCTCGDTGLKSTLLVRSAHT